MEEIGQLIRRLRKAQGLGTGVVVDQGRLGDLQLQAVGGQSAVSQGAKKVGSAAKSLTGKISPFW